MKFKREYAEYVLDVYAKDRSWANTEQKFFDDLLHIGQSQIKLSPVPCMDYKEWKKHLKPKGIKNREQNYLNRK